MNDDGEHHYIKIVDGEVYNENFKVQLNKNKVFESINNPLLLNKINDLIKEIKQGKYINYTNKDLYPKNYYQLVYK